MISSNKRRTMILDILQKSTSAISGEVLGQETGVSRQVIVQDIALLRAEGHEILSTARGYKIIKHEQAVRQFKVRHTLEEIEDELTTIVDLGGYVDDVIISHRIYDKISAPLNIKNRRDIKNFLINLTTGKSTALSYVTSGYHYHNVYAENEEILDEIEVALKEKGYLADFLEHEIN